MRCPDCGCWHTTVMGDPTRPWDWNTKCVVPNENVRESKRVTWGCSKQNDCKCHTYDGTRRLLGLPIPVLA